MLDSMDGFNLCHDTTVARLNTDVVCLRFYIIFEGCF